MSVLPSGARDHVMLLQLFTLRLVLLADVAGGLLLQQEHEVLGNTTEPVSIAVVVPVQIWRFLTFPEQAMSSGSGLPRPAFSGSRELVSRRSAEQPRFKLLCR